MKKIVSLLNITFFSLLLSGCGDLNISIDGEEKNPPQESTITQEKIPETEKESEKNEGLVIEVAILLDTSNSMDGLINQTKSQIWKMVNKLGKARDKKGNPPVLRLALYEYGNDNNSMMQNYIREISPFTRDLDLVSEKLFSITTDGGSEYAGAVIKNASTKLDWSKESNNLRIMIIAGNEEFTQGIISYKEAISDARNKDIVINTIFCGNYEEGVKMEWKNGAILGGGQYFNIDQDQKVRHIKSPYDDQIQALNNQLNSTYLGYGSLGKTKKELQIAQDSNSGSFGVENLVERTISKSSTNYTSKSWDIVDGFASGDLDLSNATESELPSEMKGMNEQEKKDFIEEKKEEREEVQKNIQKLSADRSKFIIQEEKKLEKEGQEKTLDSAINEMIKTQLIEKGFSVE